MEPLSNAAAEALTAASGNWDFSCLVCNQASTRGLADHVPSEKHWKALGEKISWCPPSLEDAVCMDKPWVQRIQTRQGVFFFNHITGAHGLEGAMAKTVTAETKPVAAETRPLVAETVPLGPKVTPPGPVIAQGFGFTEGKFNQAHWLWVQTVRTTADQIDELISHRDFQGEPPQCQICASCPLSKAHILSLAHFNSLQQRCTNVPDQIAKDAMDGQTTKIEAESAPWVQKLDWRGESYYFNHITGKELWSQQRW